MHLDSPCHCLLVKSDLECVSGPNVVRYDRVYGAKVARKLVAAIYPLLVGFLMDAGQLRAGTGGGTEGALAAEKFMCIFVEHDESRCNTGTRTQSAVTDRMRGGLQIQFWTLRNVK